MTGTGWTIGEVTVTPVVERHSRTSVRFLPPATVDRLARHRDWLAPWALTNGGRLKFVIQALCVEAEGRKIVIDTCIGPRALPEPYTAIADDGAMLTALAGAGFGRDEVDLVICTHLHFDHVGWNTVREGGRWVPTFRRARYLVTQPEYAHWRSTAEQDRAARFVFGFEDAVTPLADAGVLDLVPVDHRVGDCLELVWTPGHSPGHVAVRITSGGEAALITGDCAHHPVQLAEPDWYTAADVDPERSSATRRLLVDTYADTGVLLIGTHFPPPGAGHLVREGGRARFRPLGAPAGPG